MASRSLIDPIEIRNLRELQASMRQMSEGSQKKLRLVFNEAAEQTVASAQRKTPSNTGRARKSIKARSEQRQAKIVAGGARARYYPWLDFGGRLPGGQERRFIRSGRFLYPSWSQNRTGVLEDLSEKIVDLAREAGLEVT